MIGQLTVREISMDAIMEPEHIARNNIDEQALMELATSIQSIGLLNPITIRAVGDNYEIIAGHRRYLAHRILRRDKILCRIITADDTAAETAKVIENIQREQLSYAEEINNVRHLHDILGLDIRQISSMIGRSRAWVQARIDALSWPPEVIGAISEGKIAAGAARKLMQIEDPSYRQYLIDCAIRNGATEWVITGWVQAYEVSKLQAPIEEIEVAPRQSDSTPYKVVIPCYSCRRELPTEQMHIIRICDHCKDIIDAVRDAQ